MKKWICFILCATLVLSSFLAAGTSLHDQQKIQRAELSSGDEYIPVLVGINIVVNFDGSYESEIQDVHIMINNWTDSIQNFTIRVTITNPYNNTGSITAFWRIAEWRTDSREFIAWLIFWFQHGCVKPIIPQPFMTPLRIEWSAADPEILVKDYTFGIIINPDEACEMALFVNIPPCTRVWSCIDYIP